MSPTTPRLQSGPLSQRLEIYAFLTVSRYHVRVSAIAAHEEMPVDNRKTGVHSCTPPLEGLRVGVYFDGRLGRGQLFDCTKEKSLVQMLALIRTASPTLFEFAFVGRKSVSFDALKSLRFPRLRRLSLWSIACPASDVRVFVLAHQPHLAELNVHYSRDHPYPTLSCISRIMRGVCPRTDNYAASGVVEDTLVHDDDRRGWGHHKCSAFAYAKRAGGGPSSFRSHFHACICRTITCVRGICRIFWVSSSI